MNVTLIYVGSLKDQWIKEGCAEFEKRLSKYCSFSNVEIKQEKLSSSPSEGEIAAALEKEADAIIAAMPKKAMSVALCVEGKLYSSEELAELIERQARDIVFIIGSTHGLSQRVKDMCDVKMSMSKMTLPHRMAKLFITEQIYRAFNINAGSHYHQ